MSTMNPVKVLVTGATGVLGRPTVSALVAAGHEVRAVARGTDKVQQLRDAGAEPVAVDLFDLPAVFDAVAGSDAVLHLATNIPPITKMARRSAWELNNRLRTESTANLLAAARSHSVKRFIKESVTFTYAGAADAWLDESSPAAEPAGLLEPTLDGERMVTDFTTGGGDGVVLRFGLFYGPGNRATEEALRLARFRRATVAGPGGAYMSSLHTDDAATAVLAALDVPGGIYNVVDDEPMTRRAYVDSFSEAFGLPRLGLTPARLLHLVGGPAGRALTASQRVSNAQFRKAVDWAPAYRNAREGWVAVAATRDH